MQEGGARGAFESGLWNLLLEEGVVEVCHWESGGREWARLVKALVESKGYQLKGAKVKEVVGEIGELPDLFSVSDNSDIVFCWSGKGTGVKVCSIYTSCWSLSTQPCSVNYQTNKASLWDPILWSSCWVRSLTARG